MPPTARPPSKEEKDKTPRPPVSGKKRTTPSMDDLVGRMERLETRVREIEGRSKAPATKRPPPPSGNN